MTGDSSMFRMKTVSMNSNSAMWAVHQFGFSTRALHIIMPDRASSRTKEGGRNSNCTCNQHRIQRINEEINFAKWQPHTGLLYTLSNNYMYRMVKIRAVCRPQYHQCLTISHHILFPTGSCSKSQLDLPWSSIHP